MNKYWLWFDWSNSKKLVGNVAHLSMRNAQNTMGTKKTPA